MGEVLISLHENEDPMLGIDVVPFLATSYEEARRLWDGSKPAIEKRLASQGLMVLFAVPWPPQGIYSRQEINQVGDMRACPGGSITRHPAHRRARRRLCGHDPGRRPAAGARDRLINAFMTSSATGYDSKAWEHMSYFYDAQAWIPKNVTS